MNMGGVFLVEEAGVVLPLLVLAALGEVQDIDVAGDGGAQAGEVGCEGEVEIVMVEAVEGFGVERDFIEHGSSRSEEEAVHGLDVGDGPRWGGEDANGVSTGGMGVGDLAENKRRAGGDPFGADEAGGSSDADEVEVLEVLVEAGGEVGVEDFDVVVAEDDVSAAGLREPAGVAFGERFSVGDSDDFVRVVLEERGEILGGRGEAGVVDGANDDRSHWGNLSVDELFFPIK